MLDKGIVLKINQNYAIVLTEENNYLRIKVKDNIRIGQKILFTSEDILQTDNRWKEHLTMSKKMIVMASCFVLLFLLGGLFVFNGYLGAISSQVATIVTVDINPSVKLLLNADNEVIEVEALNEDANTLDLSLLVGQQAEDAVEAVVILAKEAGFINEEDLEEDYVLITTVSVEEDDEMDSEEVEEGLEENEDSQDNEENLENDKDDELQEVIEDKIEESDELQNVNVAIIKATKVELREAEGKKIPVGLLVVNGKIEVEGEYVSVKEFFASEQGKKAFEKQGEIIEKKLEKKIQLAEKFLSKLENAGVDVSSLRAKLENSETDIDALLGKIKAEWEAIEDTEEIDEEDEDELDEDDDEDEDEDDDEEKDEDETELDEDEDEDKAEKALEKAEEKIEKAKEKAEKAQEKAEEKIEKAEEKAEKAQEKAEEKKEKAEEKANKKSHESDDDDDDDDDEDDE